MFTILAKAAASASSYRLSLWRLPVPYVVDSSIDSKTLTSIGEAIKEFGTRTCISFREKVNTDSDYVEFRGDKTGCWSYVGRVGGQQTVNLQAGVCNTKVR